MEQDLQRKELVDEVLENIWRSEPNPILVAVASSIKKVAVELSSNAKVNAKMLLSMIGSSSISPFGYRCKL